MHALTNYDGSRRRRRIDRHRRRHSRRGLLLARVRAVVLPEDVEVSRDARLVRALAHDVLAEAGLEARLLVDELAELVLGQLEERAEARRGDELREPNEAFPERWVRPDLLGDETREERRGYETDQRAVGRDRLDDLRGERLFVAKVAVEGGYFLCGGRE